ncbi:MAG: SDR family oxidoreductase [Actinobacteria bacterium]|nr:SDR family oxidoreductase [Actinomycetota bacterium]
MTRVVVTGGAGFIGSHLCEALILRGSEVVCIDDLSTGSEENIASLLGTRGFSFIRADVSRGLDVEGKIDAVLHLASPASPPAYLRRPLETLAVGSRGTEAAISLAARHGARFIMASTSEVYGDPAVHPQPESYWGNVNPIGVRSVYDEAKRFSEALTMAYGRERKVDVGIVRIFNTYGPRLRAGDGRVVSNFVSQALSGEPLTVYGDGSQTRSFCYIDDLVSGLLAMVDSDVSGPINLGNPAEYSVSALADMVIELTGSKSKVITQPLPADDPVRRCPDISTAKRLLGWEPVTDLVAGLERTIDWFRSEMKS